MKLLDQDFGFIKPVDRCMIIGAAGTGKSVTMHYIAEGLHAKGAKINMLAPTKIMQLKKEGKLPEWLNLINYKWPKFEADAMTLYDDAQLQSYAREYYERRHFNFNKILSVARHHHAGIIITTQQTNEIDRGIIPKLNYMICKEPNLFAVKMDRPELRKFEEEVHKHFQSDVIGENLDPQQYSYVIKLVGASREGFVGPTGLPSYWTNELGDW